MPIHFHLYKFWRSLFEMIGWKSLSNSFIFNYINFRFLLYLSSENQYASEFQGFNSTLTEPVDIPGRRGGQIKEMELKLHPDLKEPLKKLCDDPKTTVIILSGSDRGVLDDVYNF